MRAIVIAAVLTVSVVAASRAVASPAASGRPQDRAWIEAFGRGDPAAAKRAIESLRADAAEQTNPILLYNLACAEAMLGDDRAALASLFDALAVGFVDLHAMDRDQRLASLREHPGYRRVVDNWATLLDRRIDAEVTAQLTALGDRYAAHRDDERRLVVVTHHSGDDLAAIDAEIDRLWACAQGIFPAAPPDLAKPDPWLLLLLPTPEDFASMAGRGVLAGFYDHDRRRLVARDIGPTLRHELFHAIHYRRMARLAQRHPVWVLEGLATLVEDAVAGATPCDPSASWRDATLRRLARANALTPWDRLMSMDNAAFLGDRAQAHYAQARGVMLYLHERGELEAWVAAFIEAADDDPTGARALERTLAADLPDAQRAFRAWARELEVVEDDPAAAGDRLGVGLRPGAGVGPIVHLADDPAELLAAAKRGGPLRHGDLIVALDGVPTRTLNELARELAGRAAGDAVQVTVRRRGVERQLKVTLTQ